LGSPSCSEWWRHWNLTSSLQSFPIPKGPSDSAHIHYVKPGGTPHLFEPHFPHSWSENDNICLEQPGDRVVIMSKSSKCKT
jgi:hypothetical protein